MKDRDVKLGEATQSFYWYPPPRWQPATSLSMGTRIQDKLTVVLDTKIPKGRRRRVNNPQIYKTYRGTAGTGTQKWRYNGSAYIGNSAQQNGVIIGIQYDQVVDTVLQTTAYNQALGELFEAIRGNLDLSIDAGQRQQTWRMIKSVFNLVEYVHSFKRNLLGLKPGKPLSREEQRRLWLFHRKDWRDRDPRVFDWRRSANEIGSKWLEYQYGWKPLVQEIYDTAELIVNPDTRLWESEFIGRGKAFDVVPISGTPTMGGATYTSKRSVRSEVSVVLKPQNSRLQELAKFSSLNPVSIAWELMPYSFVVDWFIDIGGFLRSAESSLIYADLFLQGRNTMTARNTMKGNVQKYYRSPGYPATGTYESWSSCSEMVSVYSLKNRSILSSMPLPARPVFRPRLGATRLANAAALLTQFLGKK